MTFSSITLTLPITYKPHHIFETTTPEQNSIILDLGTSIFTQSSTIITKHPESDTNKLIRENHQLNQTISDLNFEITTLKEQFIHKINHEKRQITTEINTKYEQKIQDLQSQLEILNSTLINIHKSYHDRIESLQNQIEHEKLTQSEKISHEKNEIHRILTTQFEQRIHDITQSFEKERHTFTDRIQQEKLLATQFIETQYISRIDEQRTALTKNIEEWKQLYDHERIRVTQLTTQLQHITNTNSNSSSKGRETEQLHENILNHIFSNASITNMAKTKESGDLHITFPDGFTILWDSKHFTRNVPTKDINKIHRDLDINSDIHAAILCSHTSGIAGKEHLSFDLTPNMKPVIYICNFHYISDKEHTLQSIIHILRSIIKYNANSSKASELQKIITESRKIAEDIRKRHTRLQKIVSDLTREIDELTLTHLQLISQLTNSIYEHQETHTEDTIIDNSEHIASGAGTHITPDNIKKRGRKPKN